MSGYVVHEVLMKLKEYGHNAGHGCDVEGCDKFTVGFICINCKRKLCNNHLYFSINVSTSPTNPICPSCIVNQHPELFEVEVDDDDVLEAEYEEDY